MPRAIWNGSVSFGPVTIPVKLYNAASRRSVSFNQLDDRTMSRIISTPVSWEEAEAATSGSTELVFGPADMIARVESMGDLFADVATLEQWPPTAR
ncbi:MAG: hypothetical protein GY708_05640 [Actinomycetia bacterium]|nr:hypothetical protein [Actinomycetes bacterium]